MVYQQEIFPPPILFSLSLKQQLCRRFCPKPPISSSKELCACLSLTQFLSALSLSKTEEASVIHQQVQLIGSIILDVFMSCQAILKEENQLNN